MQQHASYDHIYSPITDTNSPLERAESKKTKQKTNTFIVFVNILI